MANKKIQKLEAHDAAGYETMMETFDGADDGYGNRVEMGDLSMQRLIERGGREGQPLDASPTGYDTDPITSPFGRVRGASRGGRRSTVLGAPKVRKVMQEYQAGTLQSGSGGQVTNRRQALAIALSEARRRKG